MLRPWMAWTLGILAILILLAGISWGIYLAVQPVDCQLSEWGPCGPDGFQTKSVVQQPLFGGQPCPSQMPVQACSSPGGNGTNSNGSASACSYTDWTEWMGCPSCVDGCLPPGEAYAYSYRIPTYTPPGASCDISDMIRTQLCATVAQCPVPVNCVPEDEWGPWTDCSVPCMPAGSSISVGVQYSYRGVKTPASNGGRDCTYDQLVQTRACGSQPCTDTCQYSSTPSDWSQCTSVCFDGLPGSSYGTQYRTYAVLSGSTCTEPMVEVRPCNSQSCASVTGGPAGCSAPVWDMLYGACEALCDNPTLSSTASFFFGSQTCPVTYGMLQGICPGRTCPAPVNCSYSDWSAWSPCTQPCPLPGQTDWVGGTRVRTRAIVQPARYGGIACDVDALVDQQVCDTTDSFLPFDNWQCYAGTTISYVPAASFSSLEDAQTACVADAQCVTLQYNSLTGSTQFFSLTVADLASPANQYACWTPSTNVPGRLFVQQRDCSGLASQNCSLTDWYDLTTCPPCAPDSGGAPTKQQGRNIVHEAKGNGVPCSQYPMFQEVPCQGLQPCDSGCTPCVYMPWPQVPAYSDCDSVMATMTDMFFGQSLHPSGQLALASLPGAGLGLSYNCSNGITSHPMPADLAQRLNSGCDFTGPCQWTVPTGNLYALDPSEKQGWVLLPQSASQPAYALLRNMGVAPGVAPVQTVMATSADDCASQAIAANVGVNSAVYSASSGVCTMFSQTYPALRDAGHTLPNAGAQLPGTTMVDIATPAGASPALVQMCSGVTPNAKSCPPGLTSQPWRVNGTASDTCPSFCPMVLGACALGDCEGCGNSGVQSMLRQPWQPQIGSGCDAQQACSIEMMVWDQPCSVTLPCPPVCPPDSSGAICGAPTKGACSASTGHCVCNPGFGGPACDNSCPSDDSGNICFGNGTCSELTSFLCQCAPGWTGPACQIPQNGSFYTTGLVVGNRNNGAWCVDIAADAVANTVTSAVPLQVYCAATTDDWQDDDEFGCVSGQFTERTCESLGFASTLSYQGGFAPNMHMYGRRPVSTS